MRKECLQANPDCKYFDAQPPPELKDTQDHGCYSDKSHLIPRRAAECALSHYIVRRPENWIQECREEHDKRTRFEDLYGDIHELPDREKMIGIIMVDIAAGREVPRSVRKELKKGQEEIASRRGEIINDFWQDKDKRRK